jgi:Tfp pilus assembly PilM family ATPase
MLGRLAVRFAKEVPEDPRAQSMVKQLAAKLKQGERAPRMHLPTWKGTTESWMGGHAGLLALPTSIDLGDHALMRTAAGRFSVAFGLALQGLGMGRVRDHLGPKQGLLRGLARRKKTLCWGIDLGAAALKAVCLEQRGDGVAVTACYHEEYESPVCRASFQGEKAAVIRPVVENFLAQHPIEDVPLWGNVSGSHLITRFVRLPNLKDKQAAMLLEQEIEQRIPMPIDELAVVRWMHDMRTEQEDRHGRPAVIIASRRRAIEERLEMFTELGLPLTGLQADNTALVNFVSHEFAEVFATGPEQPDQPAGDATVIPTPNDLYSKTPAIAVLDCGAATANLVIVSSETHWMWTGESAGEDLTSALARVTKTTHAEAEQLKRNPASIESPARQYAPVERRQDETRLRFQTVLADALQQNQRFEILQSWCVGGGCLAHEWIRRLMTSAPGD